MLPVPQKTFRDIDNIISEFLWGGKKPKISRLCLEKKTLMGGLGLHNIQNRVKAAKIKWLKRFARPPTEAWHYYLEFKSDKSGYELAVRREKHKKLETTAPFYGQILGIGKIFIIWNRLQKKPSEMNGCGAIPS